MSHQNFATPILLVVFNRPKPTKIVFDRIKIIRPEKLFVFADGPRENNPTDLEKCDAVRKLFTGIDWICDFHTKFLESNLGCGVGVSSAITWFFENVEEGIILEDDCLPSYSFFPYCSQLLDLYRNNQQVMHISGDNFQYGRKRGPYSYYFSRYTHNWGWATWRRAWKYFDLTLISEENRQHIWDQQWEMSVERNGGVGILPNKNLVKNFGFDEDATHTKIIGKYSYLEEEEIQFPLKHPKTIKIDKAADFFTEYTHFRGIDPNLIWRYQIIDYFSKSKKFLKKSIKYVLIRFGLKRVNK